MKKIYLDIVREIKRSLGRFISIFVIVAIGVAFFAGIKASAPLMKETADRYFDEYRLMDVRVVSTVGFNEANIAQIKKTTGVEGLFATHSVDALFKKENVEYAYRLMTLPKDLAEDNPNYMNRAMLIEGRMPKNNNECVIEKGKIHVSDIQLGDQIELYTDKKNEDLSDTLSTTTFTVVGFINNPYYLSYQMGSTNIGSGMLDGYMMVFDEVFKQEYYTDVYLTAKDALAYNSYADNYYDEVIDPLTEKLETLGKIEARQRAKEVKQKAYESYNEGLLEFQEAKAEFNREIKDAENKLVNAYLDLVDGQKKLEEAKLEFQTTYEDATQQIMDAQQQLDEAQLEMASNQTNLNEQKELALSQMKELVDGIATIQIKLDDVNIQIEEINLQLDDATISDIQRVQLESTRTQLEVAVKQMTSQLEKLQAQYDQALLPITTAQIQIDEAQALLDTNQAELDAKQTELEEGKMTAETEFKKSQTDIDQGWFDYYAGHNELEENRQIGQEELRDAEEELEKAESDILSFEDGEWFVLDRNSHYSYVDYGGAADRMGAVAELFPVFFFLVAALICLTTMTRMVDEQRETIGTLKALGYSKPKIAARYLIYALISSLGGCIVGVLIGFAVFPMVIFNAWGIMYSIPPAHVTFYPDLAIIASVSAIVITLAATLFAVYKELAETPALLMRPKAPKNGKRIFLERITFVWSHLSFTHKVTWRNLFRYKKRFFMTVIGISGCTALLVTGFGVQDSIGNIVTAQFEEIQQYDVSVQISKDLNVVEREKTFTEIQNITHVSDSLEIAEFAGEVSIKNKEQPVSIMVPSDMDTFTQFHQLKDRRSQQPINTNNNGAMISEKMAMDLRVGIGDTIKVTKDDVQRKLTVSGIFENYVNHVIVMSEDYYKFTYGISPKPTNVLVKLKESTALIEEKVGRELTNLENVDSVVFYSGAADQFTNMISSLSTVVVVLIVSAGLLAFVVLYNLTNVNISERIREIATIKVLGFYDKEVSSYVFRENIILSLVGAIVGLGLGTMLHAFVMTLAELDNVMFGRGIFMQSYLISLVITMFFSWLVAKTMHYKLKKINMVESLKSVE